MTTRRLASILFRWLLVLALFAAVAAAYGNGLAHGYSVANAETAAAIYERNAARAQVSALLAVPGTTTLDCRMISWTP